MLIQTLEQFSASAGVVPPPHIGKPGDAKFQWALQLIRQHRELDIRLPEARRSGLGLECLIPALLQFSRENRFIKFDPWDATIQIKQFPAALVVYQYNPYRDIKNRQASGQKPAPTPQHKPTDFLDWETFPENEHYLVWTSSAGRRYGILVQPVPIVPGHLVIASLDYDPKTGSHYPQDMTPEHLEAMHELNFYLLSLGYAMGFNGRYAGASVDHFHTQAVPKNFLPLVRGIETGRVIYGASRAGGCSLDWYELGDTPDPAESLRQTSYPARGILLESDNYRNLLLAKKEILAELGAGKFTYNSIAWQSSSGRHREVFFPRGSETILNDSLKAGYVEMSGMIVIPNQTVYDQIKEPGAGEEGLGHASLPLEQYQAFLRKVIKK